MNELRYTFLADGPADRVLLPLLTWLLIENGVKYPIQPAWGDLGRLRRRPKSLSERIAASLDLYPCDLLFVHRDAEREPLEHRYAEIQKALKRVAIPLPPVVCVVPVRMQEAWLLFDEMALRHAASNPNGRHALNMPDLARIEALSDPKAILYELLREASGRTGRRLTSFRESKIAVRLVEYIDDFSPLRALPAFRKLETDLSACIQQNAWNTHSDGGQTL